MSTSTCSFWRRRSTVAGHGPSCALRPGEALKMQWSEVDLEKKLLTVAAPRMKGRKGKTKPHVVPLSSYRSRSA